MVTRKEYEIMFRRIAETTTSNSIIHVVFSFEGKEKSIPESVSSLMNILSFVFKI